MRFLTDPADNYFLDDNNWILKNEIMPKSFNYTEETARLISVNTFIRLNFVSLDTPESINLLPRRLQDFTQDSTERLLIVLLPKHHQHNALPTVGTITCYHR